MKIDENTEVILILLFLKLTRALVGSDYDATWSRVLFLAPPLVSLKLLGG